MESPIFLFTRDRPILPIKSDRTTRSTIALSKPNPTYAISDRTHTLRSRSKFLLILASDRPSHLSHS
ncbi:MAG: hypothetical protein V7K27_23300 [Nostoc sp.]|uniref:hypothetical protein n=1 Tax=Nostoc sp. TaxID=1180 RepID=UPI002FF8604D